MKEKNVGQFLLIMMIAVMGLCRTASAQTYSGYLKIDDDNVKGPDSLLVTLTIPENAYVRDTVYLTRGEARDMRKASEYSHKSYYATPWMMGLKTNLVSDMISIPYAGVEIQLARRLSLDLSGWYSKWNIFYPNEQTNIYGASPELRWWYGGDAMSKGYFIGIHGNVGWYTLEWRDAEGEKIIYQNGIDDLYDSGTMHPAWSCGLTYGYSQPLDRKEHWNLEFYIGFGYASYQQKRVYPIEDGLSYYKHEVNSYVGITKVGINLTYRFSLRRFKPGGTVSR